MDAEVDSEAGPSNGPPDVDRAEEDRASGSSAEESVTDGPREAGDEDESWKGPNGIETAAEEMEEEQTTEGHVAKEGTEDEEDEDEVEGEEDFAHLIEEVEADDENLTEEEDGSGGEEDDAKEGEGAENVAEEDNYNEGEEDEPKEEEDGGENANEEEEDEPNEEEDGGEDSNEEEEDEPREEEDKAEKAGIVKEECVERLGDEESGEMADTEETTVAEGEGTEETEGDGVANVEFKEEPDVSPEMGEEYDEDFLSIPVECDLQEESQETTEKQDSGSDYSAEEAEDTNDEDYKPKSRKTRSRKQKREFDDDLPEETSEELREAYRIFQYIQICAGTHFLNHPTLDAGVADYMDIIERPIWLEEIKRRFLIGEYSEVEQFVTDLRLVLENCYRFFGRDDPHTRKALKIEQVYFQKVAALPKEERRKFLFDPQEEEDEKEGEEEKKNDSDDPNEPPKRKEFHSALLERFAGEKQRREEERRNALIEERKLASSDNEKQRLEWERETLFANESLLEMKSMWEIPQISQILQLTRSSLCVEDLPHYEVERMFLMPQSSKLLAIVMTSLLSPPISRPKLQTLPPMPYSIWSKKLAQRVAFWYKSYNQRNKDPLKAFEYLGIEAEFWSIMGDWNQLEDYEFYELSFHQRVWIIKSLCDYLMHHHKTMHDVLAEHCPEDQICTYLGEDKAGRQYLHFPIFNRGGDAVRVYRQRLEYDDWAPDPVELEAKVAKSKGAKQSRRGGKKFRKGSAAKRKEKKKKLYDFKKLNFISRNTYRMPYSLHGGRKCKKRRGRLPETHSNANSKAEPDVPFEENADGSATNSPEVSQDGLEFRRSRRSTRNKYQANYLDWSDSDDGEVADPTSRKTSSTRSKRAFSTISEGPQNSKSDEHLGGDMFASVPESSIADDATQDASLLSDEDASRSSICKNSKISVKGEESEGEEDEDDEMPDISPTKIEEFEDDALWLTKSTGKKETRRPRYDPTWLLQGPDSFELVADSVQEIRELIESFSDEDDVDLMHRINNSETKSKRTPEQKLKRALLKLVEYLEPVELKLERAARLSRNKLYNEWFEWRLRGEDFKDSAEIYWLSLLDPVERGPPVLTPQIEPPIKEKFEIKKEDTGECNSITVEVENSNAPSEAITQPEEAAAEGEGRHTRRSKRRVETNGISGDSFQSVWPDEMSTEEESGRESDHDDSWEMPSKRKRKRTRMPRKRLPPKEGQEEGEEQAKKLKKKTNDKTAHVKKRLWGSEDNGQVKDQQKSGSNTVNINDGLHSKLTLDKQGNLFITMSSGERIPLEKDDEGRIKVPNSLPKFAVLNGKTLQQLFGENRVIPKAIRRKECSTTLFPALPMPNVYGNRTGTKDEKEAGTSGSQSPKTPDGVTDPNVDVMKLLANKVSIQKAKQNEQRVYPPSSKSKSKATTATVAGTKKGDDDVEVIATKSKAKVDADVVYLSDGSDDSIELIQESTPTKPTTPRRRDGIPRIQKVVGNAKIDLPASAVKNISKSVTMSPVLPRHVTPTKNMSPQKDNQWKPVITNSRSLNANSTRMAAPSASPAWKGQRQVISGISPEVQITTTRKPTTQRNLSVYRTPNQAFVPVTSLTARPPQSNFVPVNQFVPINNQYNNSNQFQPVNNQFVPVNSPHFVPLNSQAMVQVNPVTPQPPRVRMLAGNTTITPLPPPARAQPVQAQAQSQSPTLSGQIVLVNTDKGFSYAVKLADGGTIFLTPEQVAKIREANSGKLTTMVTLHTN